MFVLVLILLLLAAVPAFVAQAPAPQADAPFDDAFVLPDDLEVTLWAESPLFFNPTNLDVDARGRIWVTEAVNYRTFKGRDGYRAHADGDRIVILEDTDGDGRADTSTVFVQDADLHAPLGLAVLGDRVVVSSAPNLIVYTDADGDDRPEDREILLTGFGSFDHDHGLHALTAGPDGRWYFNTGNAGPHVVTDRAGWTLRSGSMYTGGTPYNTENHGERVSDDGRVWVGGLALRMRPDGTGLTVLAHNFRNAYELRDISLYEPLLDSSFVFVYYDFDAQVEREWGFAQEIASTRRLFQNAGLIQLQWNQILSRDELDAAELGERNGVEKVGACAASRDGLRPASPCLRLAGWPGRRPRRSAGPQGGRCRPLCAASRARRLPRPRAPGRRDRLAAHRRAL